MELPAEKVEEHVGTLRGLRDTIGGMSKEPTGENLDRLAGCVDALAGITEALVRAMGPSKHSQAVAQEMRRGPGVEHGGAGTIEQGPTRARSQADGFAPADEPDPRD